MENFTTLNITSLTLIVYFTLYISIFIMVKLKKEKNSTQSSSVSPLILIKIGFFYGKKVDNTYYANLIVKLCKKHLKIKDITTADILQDLYSSTKFGPFFYYRNIKGFMNSSVFFWIEKKIFLLSGLMIFLHRNAKIDFSLGMYYTDWTKWELTGYKYLSALNFVEFFFLVGILLRILSLFYLWSTITDRRVSIHNSNPKLLTKLNTKQTKFFFFGVILYSLFTRLGIITKLLFYYLVVCSLNITPSSVTIPAIFVFIERCLDFIFNLCGFTHVFCQKMIFVDLIKEIPIIKVLMDFTVWIIKNIW